MKKYKIQYHATGRANYNNSGKGIGAYFYLEVHGKNITDARKNGLDEAKSIATSYLLDDAKEKFENYTSHFDENVKITISEIK